MEVTSSDASSSCSHQRAATQRGGGAGSRVSQPPSCGAAGRGAQGTRATYTHGAVQKHAAQAQRVRRHAASGERSPVLRGLFSSVRGGQQGRPPAPAAGGAQARGALSLSVPCTLPTARRRGRAALARSRRGCRGARAPSPETLCSERPLAPRAPSAAYRERLELLHDLVGGGRRAHQRAARRQRHGARGLRALRRAEAGQRPGDGRTWAHRRRRNASAGSARGGRAARTRQKTPQRRGAHHLSVSHPLARRASRPGGPQAVREGFNTAGEESASGGPRRAAARTRDVPRGAPRRPWWAAPRGRTCERRPS